VDINEITGIIIDAAMKVHSLLGPGLLESAYESCLKHEVERRRLFVASQVVVPIVYGGILIDAGFRADLMVEGKVIVELKAVEKMNPLYDAQLLTYLKLSGLKVGLLINFNVLHLKDGIRRIVHDL
jgi:GxxExxY protein